MERAGEHDDIGPAGIGLGHLDGVLIRLRAGVGEKRLLVRSLDGGDLTELFRQGHIALVGDGVEHAVEIVVGLGLDGLHHLGLGVADVQHAHAADPVQELVAVHVLDHGALAPLDDHGIGAADSLGGGSSTALDHSPGLGTRQGLGDDLRQIGSQHKKASFVIPTLQ